MEQISEDPLKYSLNMSDVALLVEGINSELSRTVDGLTYQEVGRIILLQQSAKECRDNARPLILEYETLGDTVAVQLAKTMTRYASELDRGVAISKVLTPELDAQASRSIAEELNKVSMSNYQDRFHMGVDLV